MNDSRSIPLWPEGVEPVPAAKLPAFVMRQRWYPAKDVGPPTAEILQFNPFPVPGMTAALVIWRLSPPGQEPLHMFVPIAVVASHGADPAAIISTLDATNSVLIEAFSSDAFVRAWIDMISSAEGSAANRSAVRPRKARGFDDAGLQPGSQYIV